MMKKNFKSVITGVLLTFVLFSCTKNEENTVEANLLQEELALDNNGILEIESTTYISKKSGETTKFIANEKAFDFTFTNDFNYSATNSEFKHDGDDLIITNLDTQEFIRLYHFENVGNNKLKFDVELSDGRKFLSVTYNSKNQLISDTDKCHDGPCRSIDEFALASLVEISQEEVELSCSEAVVACAQSGGKPKLKMNKNHGWFNAPESCTVECK